MNRQYSPKVEYYHEDMKQHWTCNNYSNVYHDQFGFEIHYSIEGYRLEFKNRIIHRFNNLTAAKEVSRIMINDLINVKGTFKKKNLAARTGNPKPSPI